MNMITCFEPPPPAQYPLIMGHGTFPLPNSASAAPSPCHSHTMRLPVQGPAGTNPGKHLPSQRAAGKEDDVGEIE